jgi:hypothetical protein
VVCFCHQSADAMERVLQDLAGSTATQTQADRNAARPTPLSAPAQRVVSVSNWLATRLLPSPAWQPDPAWLKQDLPVPQMAPDSIGTLGSIATLRSLSMTLFDADPFRPGTATALARVVATLNARLPRLASALAHGDQARQKANQAHWSSLANVAEAAERVEQAVSSGLFALGPAQLQAYLAPGGVPMEQWTGFTTRMTPLLPLVAISVSLGPDLSDPVHLAEAMRVFKSVSVPALADPGVVARLTSIFGVLQRVQSATGVDPARTSLEEAHEQVMARASKAAENIPAGAQPPRIAQNPACFATREVVAAAMSAPVAALAALNWRVPQSKALPALANLLPAASLIKALPAGASVQKRPCAQGCDAAGLMRSAGI